MRILGNNKAQALVEMAVIGTFVVFLFGTVLSYIQQFNDQQYARMEAFRRALYKAVTMNDEDGGSVRYTLMQRRRLVDVSGGFRKRTPATVSGSASVSWGVPATDDTETHAAQLVFRINEDEWDHNQRDYIPENMERYDKEGVQRSVWWTLDNNYNYVSANSEFQDKVSKQETKTDITNKDESSLKEKVDTTIGYNIKVHNGSEDEYTYQYADPQVLWSISQGLYRDGGQYKYSSAALDGSGNAQEIQRSREWKTPL